MPENAGTSLNSLTGSDLQVKQTDTLPGAHRVGARGSPPSSPDVPEYVMTSRREKRQRWIESEERERERRGGITLCLSLVLFVGLNGTGNT